VHVAIVLIFLGFAGEGFKQKETALLTPGQQVTVSDFTVRLDAIRITENERMQAVTGHVTVLRNGAELTKMYPARWYFRKHEDQPTTEVAIRRSFAGDLYVVMPSITPEEQKASIEVVVTPLVNWVWFGFGLLALGTFIALLPETAFTFALAHAPAGAATTTMLLLAFALAPVAALAQTTGEVVKRAPLERELENEIMCTCGGCRLSAGNCGMTMCHGKEAQLAKLKKYVEEGKSRDEVLAAFVADFGSEDILMRPRNRGFNRLAWMLPYMLAGAGLVMIVFNARRWSNKPAAASLGAGGTDDTALDARLDDELRNLD
jgi:cytochrome c-type biogenesis protein CcmH/NrfF